MTDREKLSYIRNQFPALRKFSPRFHTQYPQLPVPSSLSELHDWVPNRTREIAVLAHTRGEFAQQGCWRGKDVRRVFHDTVVFLAVCDGRRVLECCTNCAWAAGDGGDACTAVPMHSALDEAGENGLVLGIQVGDLPRSTIRDLNRSDAVAAEHLEARAHGRDAVSHKTHASFPTPSGTTGVPTGQFSGTGLQCVRPWLEDSELDGKLAEQRCPTACELALYLYLRLETERLQAWDKLRLKIMATWKQEFEPEDENCLICLSPYDDDNAVNKGDLDVAPWHTHERARTHCGHIFGRNCLFTWLDALEENGRVQNCPLCRAVTKKEEAVAHISRATIERKQWDSLKREKLQLRKELFSLHIGHTNQLRNTMQQILDKGSTPRAVYNSAWQKIMTTGRAGEDEFIHLAGAQMSEILRYFWSGLVQDWLGYLVREAIRLVRVTIHYVGQKDFPATKRFVRNTLVRMRSWNPCTESEEAMKDFLDLYLLFMAWPKERTEFEVYCAEIEEQDNGIPGSMINWDLPRQG